MFTSCKILCGDGIIISPEVCDDSNIVSGDGCDSDCQTLEHGFTCPTAGSACTSTCGDSLIASNEVCDDGSNDNIGCATGCVGSASGYDCPTGTEPTVCSSLCGNMVDDTNSPYIESCDDGNTANSDGCSSTCQIEVGWECPSFTSCSIKCGDGIVITPEACDDGNNISGDGCAASCNLIEHGFTCTGNNTQSCSSTCGDSLIASNEICDVGNNLGTSGCEIGCI